MRETGPFLMSVSKHRDFQVLMWYPSDDLHGGDVPIVSDHLTRHISGGRRNPLRPVDAEESDLPTHHESDGRHGDAYQSEALPRGGQQEE